MRGILEWRVDLCDRCNHIQPTKTIAVLYCVALSTCFVGCLYAFVPSTIRALDRNHAQQIRRRVMVASIMSAASTLIYPIVFCSDGPESNNPSPSALEIMGWKSSLQPLFGVLVHTSLLYLGPIVTSLLHFHITCRRRVLDSSPFALLCAYFVHPLLSPFFDPVDDSERWVQIRNIIVAPITEEIVFRGCMIPPLLASGFGPITATFVVPLFFGVAHAHHALSKLQEGVKPINVAVSTAFQFMYTSLFGSYAAYAFLRTGSITAVILSHTFCNYMGIPDLSFLSATGKGYSILHEYRVFLVVTYLLGIAAFLFGLRSDILLFLPSRLPALVNVY